MKILNIISSMDPKMGGPVQGIRTIAPFILNAGYIVETICLDNSNCNYGVDDCHKIHKIGIGVSRFQVNLKLDKWLLNNLENFDFVLVHGIWQYHNYSIFNVLNKIKKKRKLTPFVAIIPHGMLAPYFQQKSDRRIKAIRNEIVWRLMQRKIINEADALFFMCEEELLAARKTFLGYNPKKEINIGFGIQQPAIFSKEMSSSFEKLCPKIKNKRFWLSLSRINPVKAIEEIIDAYIILKNETSNIPDLVIAGPIDNEYANYLLKKAEHNSTIHFTGMLTGDNKWGALYSCEFYLAPSYHENLGISIVEAMACRKPVMVSKNVNIWREIETTQSGLVINYPEPKTILNILSKINKFSESELSFYGNNAFSCFQNSFNIDIHLTNFLKALNSM